MNGIFMDTSGWVAVADGKDEHHHEASRAFRNAFEAHGIAFTTNFVFGETVTLVRRWVGYKAAREIGEKILASGWIRIIRADEGVERAAWAAFNGSRDPKLSYVDAVSIAVMRSLGVTAAFTFDGHFRQAGFDVMPEVKG